MVVQALLPSHSLLAKGLIRKGLHVRESGLQTALLSSGTSLSLSSPG